MFACKSLAIVTQIQRSLPAERWKNNKISQELACQPLNLCLYCASGGQLVVLSSTKMAIFRTHFYLAVSQAAKLICLNNLIFAYLRLLIAFAFVVLFIQRHSIFVYSYMYIIERFFIFVYTINSIIFFF